MAGDWIKVEAVTPEKPEVWLVAEAMGLSPDEVLGKLIRIWIWADQQTYDGNAGSVTKALLDRITGCTGFADELLKIGWLKSESHGLVFPNFDRHNGKSAKNRALTKKRVDSHRNAPSVTFALPEKRREEKSKKESIKERRPKSSVSSKRGCGLLPDIPFQLDTPEFHSAWSDWIKHRVEIRKQMNPLAAKEQFKKLSALGPVRAVAAIQFSIAQGYRGIFEENENNVRDKSTSRIRATDGKYDRIDEMGR